MEIKTTAADFSVDTGARSFTGYASVFGNRDSHGDVIQRGAFARTITNNDRGRIKVLWQHNSSEPIGLPTSMEEDDHGLLVTAKIADTTRGRDAMALIDAEIIDELSIGFTTVKEEWDSEKEERRLLEVKLFEFSPVTWASNELARITSVKQASDLDAVLDRLDRLRWADGHVKSERLRARIQAAIKNLDQLLTNQTPEPSVAAPSGTPQNPSTGDPAPGHSPAAALTAFNQKLHAAALAHELREFSRNLKGQANA